jgi:hypothetical protein
MTRSSFVDEAARFVSSPGDEASRFVYEQQQL